MKIRLLILICVLSIKQVNGQANNVSKYINSDSINFDLLMTMPDFENGIYHSDYILTMNSLDSIGQALIKQINKNQWMRLLGDSKSDWAANITLYPCIREVPVFSELQLKHEIIGWEKIGKPI